MIADVSPIIGRHFVSSSGNVAHASRLGPGGLKVAWQNKPTEKDTSEFDIWALSIIQSASPGDELHAHSEIDKSSAEASAAYKAWRKTVDDKT